MKKIIFVLSIVSLLLCIGVMIYRGIIFNQQCEGYLKRAADANSIELAEVERRKAIHYCEEKGLTSGYTSIFTGLLMRILGFGSQIFNFIKRARGFANKLYLFGEK